MCEMIPVDDTKIASIPTNLPGELHCVFVLPLRQSELNCVTDGKRPILCH